LFACPEIVFQNWLETNGRIPREQTVKVKARQILGRW